MVIMIVRILSVLLNIYSFVILARIIMAWFPDRDYGLARLKAFLAAVTDPYLGLFHRLRFLRIGPVDFSPVLALVLLSAVQIMLAEWLRRGVQSLVLFPVFLASAMLNTLSLFCLLLFFVIIFRIILVKVGVMGGFSTIIDQLLQPMVSRTFRFFGIKQSMPFTVQLLLFSVAILLLFFGFRILSAWLFLL